MRRGGRHDRVSTGRAGGRQRGGRQRREVARRTLAGPRGMGRVNRLATAPGKRRRSWATRRVDGTEQPQAEAAGVSEADRPRHRRGEVQASHLTPAIAGRRRRPRVAPRRTPCTPPRVPTREAVGAHPRGARAGSTRYRGGRGSTADPDPQSSCAQERRSAWQAGRTRCPSREEGCHRARRGRGPWSPCSTRSVPLARTPARVSMRLRTDLPHPARAGRATARATGRRMPKAGASNSRWYLKQASRLGHQPRTQSECQQRRNHGLRVATFMAVAVNESC